MHVKFLNPLPRSRGRGGGKGPGSAIPWCFENVRVKVSLVKLGRYD